MAHLTNGEIDLAIPGPSSATLTAPATDAQILAYAAAVTGGFADLIDPFEQYAASVLIELQTTLARMRFQHLVQGDDCFSALYGWENTGTQKIRVIGEVWGYGQFTVVRDGGDLSVPADGNFAPETLGQIGDVSLFPASLARLMSVNVGRMAMGHVNDDGKVYLDALTTGKNIHNGDIITMAGMWPLAKPYISTD